MNIIEAIKSGKDFKRDHWADDQWLYLASKSIVRLRLNNTMENFFEIPEILADDWEIKQ